MLVIYIQMCISICILTKIIALSTLTNFIPDRTTRKWKRWMEIEAEITCCSNFKHIFVLYCTVTNSTNCTVCNWLVESIITATILPYQTGAKITRCTEVSSRKFGWSTRNLRGCRMRTVLYNSIYFICTVYQGGQKPEFPHQTGSNKVKNI